MAYIWHIYGVGGGLFRVWLRAY